MTNEALNIKLKRIITLLKGYKKALEIESDYSFDELQDIIFLLRDYNKLLEISKSMSTNLSDYSVRWNYSFYLYVPINENDFVKNNPSINSLSKFSEKFTLNDIEDINPVSFKFMKNDVTIKI